MELDYPRSDNQSAGALGFTPRQSGSTVYVVTTILYCLQFKNKAKTQEVSELASDPQLLMSGTTIQTQVFGF